ncbi:hypothetical protein L1887_52913 [Cichorium endivia]|nr:hypothetical protein L1887_52913 [Cichorium endivia]
MRTIASERNVANARCSPSDTAMERIRPEDCPVQRSAIVPTAGFGISAWPRFPDAVALRARRGAGVCEEAAKTGGGRAEGMCRRPEPAAPGWARWPPCMQMSRQAISNPGPRLGPMVARQASMGMMRRVEIHADRGWLAWLGRASSGVVLVKAPPPAKMRLGPTRKVGRGCSWLTLSRRAITTAIEMLKPKGGCAVHGEAGLR